MSLPFTKMQGIGNDFIVIDSLAEPSITQITAQLARKLCDRRYGVGADQILWLKSSQGSDARMEILNADGSTAEMCGNGIRAAGLYLHRHGPKPSKSEYSIDTMSGELKVQILVERVRVNMGIPELKGGFSQTHSSSAQDSGTGESLIVDDEVFFFHEVSMGNPHAVIFVDHVEEVPLELFGPAIEHHPRFPTRTNVEFVQVLDERTIRVRVWERGAGVTLACGTGACASAVAALATRRAKGPLTVKLPGGDLLIEWAGEGKPVLKEGPAEEVFRGEFLSESP